MKTRQFITDYLKDFARITIVNEYKEILYIGDVISLPRGLFNKTKISSVEGLGTENDLIIEIVETE